jgi:hypothetical protein
MRGRRSTMRACAAPWRTPSTAGDRRRAALRRGQVATQHDPAVAPLYPDGVDATPYDPTAGRPAPGQAGWTATGDGVRQNAQGQRLAFTLLSSDDALRRAVVEVLQNQLRRVGADVQIQVMEFQTMLQNHGTATSTPSSRTGCWTTSRSRRRPCRCSIRAGRHRAVAEPQQRPHPGARRGHRARRAGDGRGGAARSLARGRPVHSAGTAGHVHVLAERAGGGTHQRARRRDGSAR